MLDLSYNSNYALLVLENLGPVDLEREAAFTNFISFGYSNYCLENPGNPSKEKKKVEKKIYGAYKFEKNISLISEGYYR
ncbi:unnamed protein product [Larinioides sclopetarius]|uniref:Uncharacterized protein n=1 Tax=Larinioides sclopetarius TaxID=280406 RepID=A0AAV2C1A3_9ARAC